MSSLPRRIQRRALRARPDYEPAAQPTATLANGGYKTLRPTGGWFRIAGIRLRAQRRMAALLDHILPTRAKRAAKALYRFQKRKPPKQWPSVETRQQKRFADRKAA